MTVTNPPTLSIVFPIHNEQGTIEKLLTRTIGLLEAEKISFEILTIENGSTDDSLSLLKRLAKKDPRIKVFQSNKGWGNAVRFGIKQAQGNLICYMVSDMQVDVHYIIELYKLYLQDRTTRKYVLFKVWRTNRENTTRLINSRIYNLFARLLFGVHTYDINATPKLMEAKLLKSIPLTSHNVAIDLELLLALKERHLRWQEIPIPSRRRDRGSSTTQLKTVWEMIRWMMAYRFK